MTYEEQLSAAKHRAERDQARQEAKGLREELHDRLADLMEPDTTTDTTKSAQYTTKCDLGALLDVARELERQEDMAAGHVAYAARFDFGGWAARIREALGEGA